MKKLVLIATSILFFLGTVAEAQVLEEEALEHGGRALLQAAVNGTDPVEVLQNAVNTGGSLLTALGTCWASLVSTVLCIDKCREKCRRPKAVSASISQPLNTPEPFHPKRLLSQVADPKDLQFLQELRAQLKCFSSESMGFEIDGKSYPLGFLYTINDDIQVVMRRYFRGGKIFDTPESKQLLEVSKEPNQKPVHLIDVEKEADLWAEEPAKDYGPSLIAAAFQQLFPLKKFKGSCGTFFGTKKFYLPESDAVVSTHAGKILSVAGKTLVSVQFDLKNGEYGSDAILLSVLFPLNTFLSVKVDSFPLATAATQTSPIPTPREVHPPTPPPAKREPEPAAPAPPIKLKSAEPSQAVAKKDD